MEGFRGREKRGPLDGGDQRVLKVCSLWEKLKCPPEEFEILLLTGQIIAAQVVSS